MPTACIIGASRGIGLALVRRYAAHGWRVHATTRTPDEPGPLGAVAGDVVIHRLDVREPAEIEALARALDGEAIDVLVHNAGINRGHPRAEVMAVNAKAPIAVTTALLDAVARSDEKKIVLVTSQLGARRGRKDGLGDYGDSKAALNDRFRELAPAWARRGITAIVIHPGWVRTDMGGLGAPVSPDESAGGIAKVAARLTPADNGRFLTWQGREHPW